MDALLVFALLIVATVLLVTERLRVDLVAMLVLAALVLLRVLEPGDALSGFSNHATVTVACMFILSAGLQASGVVQYLGDRLLLHGPGSKLALLFLIAVVIAPLSAFINNTAVVAIFLPIVLRACQGNQDRFEPADDAAVLLLAMIGGTCTLIGTSTNILVSSIAESHGHAPFKMFEFTKLGLILLVAGGGVPAGDRAADHARSDAGRQSGQELQPQPLPERSGGAGGLSADRQVPRGKPALASATSWRCWPRSGTT